MNDQPKEHDDMQDDVPFHIVAVTNEGLSIIGPFYSEQAAADYGHLNCTDPRWNVANIGFPADNGMVGEDYFNVPHFVIPVTDPD